MRNRLTRRALSTCSHFSDRLAGVIEREIACDLRAAVISTNSCSITSGYSPPSMTIAPAPQSVETWKGAFLLKDRAYYSQLPDRKSDTRRSRRRPLLGSPQQPAPIADLAHGPPSARPYAEIAAAVPGHLIDGRQISSDWQAEIAAEVAHIRKFGGRAPGLAVVLVGHRPDSVLYVERKREAAAEVGFDFRLEHLPHSATQAEIVAAVRSLCLDPAVDGVLVQLPLPPHIDEESVMEAFDPRKDVDGFHPINIGRIVMRGRNALHVPCTPLGCLEMLRRTGISVKGRHAVILGDSNIVGTPLAMLLRDAGAATVTVCHRLLRPSRPKDRFEALNRAKAGVCLPRVPGPSSRDESRAKGDAGEGGGHAAPAGGAGGGVAEDGGALGVEEEAAVLAGFSRDVPRIVRKADILVAAVGEPEFVRGSWVKPGAVVLDVGINVLSPDGSRARVGDARDTDVEPGQWHVVGDVAHEEVARVASYISPVPGGVGPMTIAALLSNTLVSAKLAMGLSDSD